MHHFESLRENNQLCAFVKDSNVEEVTMKKIFYS